MAGRPSICLSFEEVIKDLQTQVYLATMELQTLRANVAHELRRCHQDISKLLRLIDLTEKQRDKATAQVQILLNSIGNGGSGEVPAPQLNLHSCASYPAQAIAGTRVPSLPMTTVVQPEPSPSFHPFPALGNSSPAMSRANEIIHELAKKKPLPEKGQLVRAVMGAGPPIQVLPGGGPALPKFRNPPPPPLLQPEKLELTPLNQFKGGGAGKTPVGRTSKRRKRKNDPAVLPPSENS